MLARPDSRPKRLHTSPLPERRFTRPLVWLGLAPPDGAAPAIRSHDYSSGIPALRNPAK